MYKTPSNFHIGMRGGAPDLCSPLKILFTDWRLIPLNVPTIVVAQSFHNLTLKRDPRQNEEYRSSVNIGYLYNPNWLFSDKVCTVQRAPSFHRTMYADD
jgi:hypothetical protein